jgi:DNA-binding beta-propeller fold protein YncE
VRIGEKWYEFIHNQQNTSVSSAKHFAAERKMKNVALMFVSTLLLFAPNARGQADEPLKLSQTIPLPGLHDGDFDHFTLDGAGQRLFLAAEQNSAIEVIDLRTNKLVHTIIGAKAPHSMAYNPDSKKLFVADDGGPSQVEIFDGTTFKLLGTIPMKAHADSSVYDPTSKLYYVGNGGKQDKEDYCLLSIIDTASAKVVGEIRIEADRVEGMALEKSGPRMFVNLTSKNAIAVIDREQKKVIATWSIAEEGRGNAPMAFDEADHRLFVVARDSGKVIVLDSDTGRIITSLLNIGQYFSDDAAYDATVKRLYVPGVPFMNIFQKAEGDHYTFIGQVPNSFHALTAILVPQLNQYYVAINHHGNTEAAVQVYAVVP